MGPIITVFCCNRCCPCETQAEQSVRYGHNVSDGEAIGTPAQNAQQQIPMQTFGQYPQQAHSSQFIPQQNFNSQPPQMGPSQFPPPQFGPPQVGPPQVGPGPADLPPPPSYQPPPYP